MMFYPDVLTEEEANDRFDHMVAVCRTIPFGKQPVVELASGLVVGYTGVDYIDFEGRTWLEWGYRLVPERRGLGYATEASRALLAKAHQTYAGELLAIIARRTSPRRTSAASSVSRSGSRRRSTATSAASTPSA